MANNEPLWARLGNPAPQSATRDTETDRVTYEAIKGSGFTTVIAPDETYKVSDLYKDITLSGGHWEHHTYGDAVKPTWVQSNSAALANLLAEEFGCEIVSAEGVSFSDVCAGVLEPGGASE